MEYIKLPSNLPGFVNTWTERAVAKNGKKEYVIHGELEPAKEPPICPHCNCKMHVNQSRMASLKHFPIGLANSRVVFRKHQYRCPICGHTEIPAVPFQAEGHWVTKPMISFAEGLLEMGLTNSEVCQLSGLSKNVVKELDMERLTKLYTVEGEDGRRLLRRPERPARFLGIDEFSLHAGHQYATVIVDLESGAALWLEKGKKKAVVYDFIDHVGQEWMASVEAVACDMNSDFQEAFQERCPHVRHVFDYFHIVKNFNDKVVAEVRKDEQKRLVEEGDLEAAKRLKRTRYILASSRGTLARKDAEAAAGKVVRKGSELFRTEPVVRRPGYLERYESLIRQNRLLLSLDLVKGKLEEAFELKSEKEMADMINEISDLCLATGNPRFQWFSRLLLNHIDGIAAHAVYGISTSKLEGINNKIKTIRRQGYGYPDDDYFFLKVFDATRRKPLSGH